MDRATLIANISDAATLLGWADNKLDCYIRNETGRPLERLGAEAMCWILESLWGMF